MRAGYAELLAAARASVAAAARGDANPVAWARGALEDRGQFPAPGALCEKLPAYACISIGGRPHGRAEPDREPLPHRQSSPSHLNSAGPRSSFERHIGNR